MNLSPCNVRAMATSPDGRLLVTSCFDSSLHVYDCTTPSYKLVCKTAVSEGGVCALAVCASDRHDELTVVTGHWHWLVQCWRVAARQFQLKWVSDGVPEGVEKAKRRSATAACISHDCQWAAVAGYNNHGHAGPFTANDICLFSLRTAGRVFLGDTQSECISLCFSSDDRFLVSSSFDRTLRVWSVASGEQLQRLQLDSLVTCCMSLCAGGGLVTGHSDGSVRLWPALENFRLLTHRCIGRHGARVSSVHCSWDGRYAVTGGDTQGILFCCVHERLIGCIHLLGYVSRRPNRADLEPGEWWWGGGGAGRPH